MCRKQCLYRKRVHLVAATAPAALSSLRLHHAVKHTLTHTPGTMATRVLTAEQHLVPRILVVHVNKWRECQIQASHESITAD
jgi:hypothetical protein